MGRTDHLMTGFDWKGMDPSKRQAVEDTFADIRLSDEQIQRMRNVFLAEMELGLSQPSGCSDSSLLMENTFLPELPNGREQGQFLALDLGGTNFRVMYIKLDRGNITAQKSENYHIDEPTRLGEGSRLFDALAECVDKFMVSAGLTGVQLELGFTFSFPMIQKSLNVGLLQTWTKSFNASGCVGEDAVKMLSDALHRRGCLNVNVVAVLNDTTGTLVQGASQDHQCAIGVILGTGSNAAYVERIERVGKWPGDHSGVQQVAIDIEWGAFGDNGVLNFLKTNLDRAVDDQSLLVNSFTFEKYFAGKYMGEVLRQCVLRAHGRGLLLQTGLSPRIVHGHHFNTKHCSMLEKDSMDGTTHHCEQVMSDLQQQSFCADDLTVLRYVAACISVRAAVMVSACLSVLLERVDRSHCSIAVDGSLFKLHPRLSRLMEATIAALAPSKPFRLFLAEDGSGKGAALVAAVAHRLRL